MVLSTKCLKHVRKIFRRELVDLGLAFCTKYDMVAGLLCIIAVFAFPSYDPPTRS